MRLSTKCNSIVYIKCSRIAITVRIHSLDIMEHIKLLATVLLLVCFGAMVDGQQPNDFLKVFLQERAKANLLVQSLNKSPALDVLQPRPTGRRQIFGVPNVMSAF